MGEGSRNRVDDLAPLSHPLSIEAKQAQTCRSLTYTNIVNVVGEGQGGEGLIFARKAALRLSPRREHALVRR